MANLLFIYSFMSSLLATLTVTTATETDIYCLKSIKDSVIDPYGYLNTTWDFGNKTEGFICWFTGVECWHPYESRVLNIRLSDLGLKGQFPLGLENCTSLTGLDFSHNKLQGPIPSDICKRLPLLTTLDLSFNNFSGEIPSSIADCRYLNTLRLNNNKLIGHIPPQIGQLDRIKFFSVANNQLSGPLPDFLRPAFSYESFANNAGLCGKPLKKCSSHQRKFDYSFKGGFVIGYLVFSISVAICFTFYCVPWVYAGERKKKITILGMMMMLMRRKHKITEDGQAGSSLLEEGTKERKRNRMMMKTPMMTSMMQRREKKVKEANEQICKLGNVVKRWSFVVISNATANFSQSNKIGLGRMGTMYKATLPDGRFLAVKRIVDFHQFEEQIVSELKTLGTLKHKNLLPLFGFCVESNTRLLVYKYTSNGNLFDWIHSVKHRRKTLPWPLRLKIAVGVARGLARLHHGCRGQVLHLNISSKCILLDRDFEPKLSNFGKAMLMTNEFCKMAVVKEDVHGFGVVLLELITGMDCSRMDFSSNSILNEWIGHLLSASYFHDAMDRFLIGQGFDDEIFQLLKVACDCLDCNPDRRPTMIQVYRDIKAITERCEVVDGSEIQTQPEIRSATSQDHKQDQ